jgi:hypothetical protein
MSIYKDILAKINDSEKITYVNESFSKKTTNNTTTFNCATQPNYSNASFTV